MKKQRIRQNNYEQTNRSLIKTFGGTHIGCTVHLFINTL